MINYVASMVVAVPVCRPARPTRAHPSLGHRRRGVETQCLYMEVCRSRLWTCLLRMETPPLRMGDVPFTDGNAAARTFGRAHRRRPYHFSRGSVFQGCQRTVCRRTKSRKGCQRTVCRWTKTRKGCWRTVRRWTKTKKVAGEQFADGLNRKRLPANSSPTD